MNAYTYMCVHLMDGQTQDGRNGVSGAHDHKHPTTITGDTAADTPATCIIQNPPGAQGGG
jgi:hypothetical protein